jgi:DNA-binding NtrC family response regulator
MIKIIPEFNTDKINKFGLLRNSPQIQNLLLEIKKVSAVDAPIMITGESSTGKKFYAWPGNIQEMMNRIRPSIQMCDKELITVVDLGIGMPFPDATLIGEDPKKDAQRFYGRPESIVLVTSDMLGQNLHHGR